MPGGWSGSGFWLQLCASFVKKRKLVTYLGPTGLIESCLSVCKKIENMSENLHENVVGKLIGLVWRNLEFKIEKNKGLTPIPENFIWRFELTYQSFMKITNDSQQVTFSQNLDLNQINPSLQIFTLNKNETPKKSNKNPTKNHRVQLTKKQTSFKLNEKKIYCVKYFPK